MRNGGGWNLENDLWWVGEICWWCYDRLVGVLNYLLLSDMLILGKMG